MNASTKGLLGQAIAMPDLSATLRSAIETGSPVEETAGLALEIFVNSGVSQHFGNFASNVLGEAAGGQPSNQMKFMLEALYWLESHGMLAQTNQQGMYFVTRKGNEIGNAGNLRTYLANQESKTQADLINASERTLSDIADMKKRAESEINQAIEDAKKEAQSVLILARQTAQNVSLSDVQEQFSEGAKSCLTGVWIWAILSSLFCAGLVVAVIGFLTWWEPSFQAATRPALNQMTTIEKGAAPSVIIYHTVLRVTLLTAIAALAAFCLKILRAQLHLREQNLHRQRVANSMAAFLGATTSTEQRDLILGRLADAITSFGNSGLLADDEVLSPAKVILESVQRGLSSKG